MGSGKSTWMINHINQNPKKQYFIITPLLSEVGRYKNALSSIYPVEPKNWNTSKLQNLKQLIAAGKNIVTTHQLIRCIDKEALEYLQANNYTFILDESLEVVEPFPIKKADFNAMTEGGYIKISEEGYVLWNEDDEHKSSYDGDYWKQIKRLCELQSLMAYSTANGDIISFIWNFPKSFFQYFENGYILTYLWEGSLQKYYFDFHNIQYDKYIIMDNQLKPWSSIDYRKQIDEIKDLIRIIDDAKLNAIGKTNDKKQPLSSTWYKANKQKDTMKILKNNIYNFFFNKMKSPSIKNMWSTFKEYKTILKGRGYSGSQRNPCFVPVNARATNDYIYKENLAYVVNIYCDPCIVNFFSQYGIEIDQRKYALAQLVQWIWRSRIRDGKNINLYLPSERMRDIIFEWLIKS